MATKIEWVRDPTTDRKGETWNPITGCDPDDGYQSEACVHCYARRMAKRLAGRAGYDAEHPFRVTEHADKLLAPLQWARPRMVFVDSMGDLFHDDAVSWHRTLIRDMFAVMALATLHTFIVLTKRPRRALALLTQEFADDVQWAMMGITRDLGWGLMDLRWPLPNLWLGVTAENQKRADERVPILIQIPAAVRLVSVEPMLEAVTLFDVDGEIAMRMQEIEPRELRYPADAIDWVIAGGETGPGARPMHPAWVRSLRDECSEADVAFFFKSWGEYAVGRKRAGRLLDGREWNEYPKEVLR